MFFAANRPGQRHAQGVFPGDVVSCSHGDWSICPYLARVDRKTLYRDFLPGQDVPKYNTDIL